MFQCQWSNLLSFLGNGIEQGGICFESKVQLQLTRQRSLESIDFFSSKHPSKVTAEMQQVTKQLEQCGRYNTMLGRNNKILGRDINSLYK